MSTATITVQGEHTVRIEPERATVHATVTVDGPEREPVVHNTSATAKIVSDTVAALHHAERGPVVEWSSDRIRVTSHRPWNNNGVQMPLVHAASVTINVTFSDFEALAAWVTATAITPGVQMSDVEWSLSDEKQRECVSQARTGAVKDASEKALGYAFAAGLHSINVVAIADPGMLGTGSSDRLHATPMMARGMMMESSDAVQNFEFIPRKLEISASVDVRFEAK